MARWVGTQGQVSLAKKAKTCAHCDVIHKKKQTQIKIFLNWKKKTCRISRWFEHLSSSIAW